MSMLCTLHKPFKKKKKTIFLFLILFYSGLEAQVSVGIIKTASDFLNGIVFTADKERQLYLHDLSNKDYVDIRHHDSTYRFYKNDIFGYCDGNGNVYRFFNNEIYPILNPGEKILIYKITTGTGMKNSPVTEQYFFSKNANTNILPLSYQNLFNEFADNPSFLLLLEVYYKNDNDLLAYDDLHKIYKLNRLMELSKRLKMNE